MNAIKKEVQKDSKLMPVTPVETEAFKTFIVRFIGDQQYSFYNVEQPNDGTSTSKV